MLAGAGAGGGSATRPANFVGAMTPGRVTGSAPIRIGLAVFAASAVALGLLAAALFASGVRSDLAPAGDRLAARADRLVAQLEGVRPARRPAALRESGVPARLVEPGGAVRAEFGGAALWKAGSAPAFARLAAMRAGWRPVVEAVEVSRVLPAGDRLVLRAPVAEPALAVGPAGWIALVGALLLSALAGAAAWFAARRQGRHADALAEALEASTAGRAAPAVGQAPAGWERITAATEASVARLRELTASSEAGIESLSSVLSPLPIPAAGRTSPRRLVRNDALERLVAPLLAADRTTLELALDAALDGSGLASRRMRLADGRSLEIEAWGVPEGRVVVCAERTEQERLGALRRRLTGSAAARLQAPVAEIQAAASHLHAQLPPSTAPSAAGILATADRLQGMLRALLRTEHRERRAVGPTAVGLAGVLWAQARNAEQRLRAAGLRVELELPEWIPPARVDPDTLGEVLGELMANAERFTPRGGTITLWAAPGGPDTVLVGVRDTGPGVPPDELDAVGEPFVRGRDAVALPGNGLGLGLARALAERMGGGLAIEAGPGCRAVLELPSAEPMPTTPDSHSQPEPEETHLAA